MRATTRSSSLKRYTTVTMGPAQGKLETVNAVAVLAEATGSTIAETGTTTWRPMHVPSRSAPWPVGSTNPSGTRRCAPRTSAWVRCRWWRASGSVPTTTATPPPRCGRSANGVGIIDVTPIGKLDLRGPDVPTLLNLLYVNKWSKLEVGRVRYGVMCAEDGVVLDDGVTGRLAEDRWLMSTTSSGAARCGSGSRAGCRPSTPS